MSHCLNCGGKVKYDIKTRQLLCESCQSQFDVYQYDQQISDVNSVDYQVNSFTCPQCGGELLTTDNDITGNCSYCGANVIFESKMVNEKRPAWIVPFSLTKEDCKEIYQKEVNKRKFASKLLKDSQYIDGFRGIYVPYWLYDVSQDGRFSFRAVHSYIRGDYRIEDIYKFVGKSDCRYEQIGHDASSVFHDEISERVEPFDMTGNNIMPFTPSYFAGFYAETTDVDPTTYNEYVISVANDMMMDYLHSIPDISRYRIDYPADKTSAFNTKIKNVGLAALPVWFLSYKNRDRVAYAAINGQTGRMISDIPIQVSSVLGASAIAGIIIFLLLSFISFNPATVTIIAVLVSGLVTKFCHDDIRDIIRKDKSIQGNTARTGKNNNSLLTFIEFVVILVVFGILRGITIMSPPEQDFLGSTELYSIIGVVALIFHIIRFFRIMAAKKKIANCGYTKFPYPLFCLLASIAGVVVLFLNPVYDEVYYAAIIGMIVMELFAFVGIVNNYNIVATRTVPQFEIHRGGDDNVY